MLTYTHTSPRWVTPDWGTGERAYSHRDVARVLTERLSTTHTLGTSHAGGLHTSRAWSAQ